MDDAIRELPEKKAKLEETRRLLERLESKQGEVSADRYDRLSENYRDKIAALEKDVAELTDEGETRKIELEDRIDHHRNKRREAGEELKEIETLHKQGALDKETYRSQRKSYSRKKKNADRKVASLEKELDELNYYLTEVGEESYQRNKIEGTIAAASSEARKYSNKARDQWDDWTAGASSSRKWLYAGGGFVVVLLGLLLFWWFSGMSPEEARQRLADLNEPFTVENFVKAAVDGDEMVVNLFTAADMNPNKTVDMRIPFDKVYPSFLIKRVGAKRLEHRFGEDGVLVKKLTPLIGTTFSNNSELTQNLLDMGADPKMEARTPNSEITALTQAVIKGNSESVEVLLEAGANANVKTGHNFPVIIIAAALGYPKIVQNLLDAGVNPNIREQDDENTALLLAIKGLPNGPDISLGKRAEIIEALLDAGANPNLQNERSEDALFLALIKDNNRIIELILDSDIKIAPTVNKLITQDKYKQAIQILKEADAGKTEADLSLLKEKVHLNYGIYFEYRGDGNMGMSERITSALRQYIKVLRINPHNKKARSKIDRIISIYSTMPAKSLSKDIINDLRELKFNLDVDRSARVTGSDVIIRSDHTTESKVAGVVKKEGTRVRILSEYYPTNSDEAILKQDISVYANNHSIELHKGKAVSIISTNGNRVWVKFATEEDGNLTATINKSDLESISSKKWYKVRTKDNTTGWMYGKFIEEL